MIERDPRTYAIIGAAMEVHKQLGHGFLEAVYREALMIEFETRQIPFLREVELPIHYRGRQLVTYYRADFVCYSSVIVELKALSHLSGVEEANIIDYLKATEVDVGILLNFGAKSLEYKRFSLTFLKSAKSAQSADKSPGGPDMEVTLREAQGRVDEWIRTVGVRYYSELTNLAVLVEEVGEVARLMSRMYGDQSFKESDKGRELAEEFADVLFVLICLANQTGVDLTAAFAATMDKKTSRDRERHANNTKLRAATDFTEDTD